MEFIIKIKRLFIHCFFMILAAIPMASFAQEVIDTSSPEDRLISPTLVMSPVKVEPDCHTYTGCGLIVVEKYIIYPKPKRHCVYRPPCY